MTPQQEQPATERIALSIGPHKPDDKYVWITVTYEDGRTEGLAGTGGRIKRELAEWLISLHAELAEASKDHDEESARLRQVLDLAWRERDEARNERDRMARHWTQRNQSAERLASELIEARRQLEVARKAIEDAPCQDSCHTQLDKCRRCGEEFDAHPNDVPDGDLCEEFAPQLVCDCEMKGWRSRALAGITAPAKEQS